MAFTTIEELKAAVDERRKSILTLEVELGGTYSQEHEDAKRALATAKGLQSLAGGQGFLGEQRLEDLEAKVAATKPESPTVWIQYRRIGLNEWAELIRGGGATPLEQYEKVLPQTFVGVWGVDPVKPDNWDEIQPGVEWTEPTPLSTHGSMVSSKGLDGILLGGVLHSVVGAFMNWQNSGGEVSIRPTRSGLG